MSWTTHQAEIEELAESIEPTARVVVKRDHWVSHLLAWFLFVVSFGKFKREDFMTNYANVVGHLILIPEEWSVHSAREIVPHETTHVRQCKRMGGNIHPIVGVPVAAIVYGLLLFPVGLAIGRVLMEVQADMNKWRHLLNKEWDYDDILYAQANRAYSLSQVGYLYAMPHFITSWIYKKAAQKVILEYEQA